METSFLRRIEGKTIVDKIRSKVYRTKLKVKPLTCITEQGEMGWFNHINHMNE